MSDTLRHKNCKPRLVRVAPGGYVPELLWGICLSNARLGEITVVTVRATEFAAPQTLRLPVTAVTRACLLAAPEKILVNLVKHKLLSDDEYAEWARVRLMARLGAEEWKRECRASKATRALRPWANIGKGKLTGEARRFLR